MFKGPAERDYMSNLKKIKVCIKAPIWFKSKAYTLVREHFKANRDAPLKIKIAAESGFAWQRSHWA